MISRRAVAALSFAFVAAFGAGFAAPAAAQPAADASAIEGGAYTLDARHTAVIARVPHQGFSFEVFRFNTVSGQVNWNATTPASSTLSATVDVASIDSSVPGFPEELAGERFLNAAAFPQATFTSTAFRQIDASHGEVDGVLTIKGVAKNVTFHVELIGAGRNQRGAVFGLHAETQFDAEGLGLPPFIAGPFILVIDAEFNKAAS